MNRFQGDGISESPQEFADRVSLKFNDHLLLRRALTHRSYINENPEALEDNERLEFLGDAVLDYVVGVWLYNRFPEMSEGDLTRLRAALVRTEQLANFGKQIGMGAALRLGRGEAESGGRTRRALLCGAFEALSGAICLDSGIGAVADFMSRFLENATKEILLNHREKDPKSTLQEIVQAEGAPAPFYRVISESGPDHDKTFEVEVLVDGQVAGCGTGSSKQEASVIAAESALENYRR
ncbi:MAG: ribonuclease III [Anaerolineales bacterium]|jgi:ribonuclease-3